MTTKQSTEADTVKAGITPGPYRMETDGDEVYIVDATGLERVATLAMQSRGQRLRDGSSIVRACNSHAALLAERDALRTALSELLAVAWPNEQADSRTSVAMAKARAALAQKGEV